MLRQDENEVTKTKINNSRLIFHPAFNETLKELGSKKITLPKVTQIDVDFSSYGYPVNGELVSGIEEPGKFKLDCRNGQKICDQNTICAYDESIKKFEALEGSGFLTSHSMIIHGRTDYIPINLLTFYFYTRSSYLTNNSKYIKFSNDFEVDSKRDYVSDRKELLVENIPENCIIFIDGPLIGGQMTKYTLDLNELLLKKNTIPIFFVKNSRSNLVVDNIEELKNKYNSDMHFSYVYLKTGERTKFFMYVDKENYRFTKVFCYIKAFESSPCRIEIDINTYNKYKNEIDQIMDLAYFLLIAQGDLHNPQIRSIAIAEKYARATLKLINFEELIKTLGVTPTMNQERFAW